MAFQAWRHTCDRNREETSRNGRPMSKVKLTKTAVDAAAPRATYRHPFGLHGRPQRPACLNLPIPVARRSRAALFKTAIMSGLRVKPRDPRSDQDIGNPRAEL